jgi:predicted GNAT family acetyltransferase
MRIHELVNTKSLNPEFKDQRQVGDILLKAQGGSAGRLHVRAFDVSDPGNPIEAGFADFAIRTNAQGEDYLRAYYTFVNKSYRGKGIAKQIYLFVNDIGNDIMPSELQTDLGKQMWRGLSKSIRQPSGQPAPKPEPEPTRLDKFKKFFSGFRK